MAEPSPPPPQYDPKAVYVNGQAIGLIASLVDGLRRDLRTSETNLRADFKDFIEDHESSHARTRSRMTEVQDKIMNRLDALETTDRQAAEVAKVKAARREGQLSIVKVPLDFFDKHRSWLVPVAAAIFGSSVLAPVLSDILKALGIAPK